MDRMAKFVLIALACLATTQLVRADERIDRPDVDSNLGPQPISPGAETLLPRDFRAGRAAGNYSDTLLAGYLTNAQLGTWTSDFVSRCSSIARRFSIGKSTNGVDLWVVEISANPGVVEAKPNFRYVANMHGDEPSGRMLLPMMAEWLCNNRNDPRASRIINNMHLFLMPTMNPDGFAVNSRANGAGADLNRNFPGPFAGSCKGKAPENCRATDMNNQVSGSTQPETRAMMAWTLDPNWPFHFASNMHEGAVCANYPWDGYNSGTTAVGGGNNNSPDNAAYVYLAKVYSTSHTWMSTSSAFRDGITNGAGWYPIYGSLQDFDYAAGGCMELTLELNQQKRPAASRLPTIWRENFNALLQLPIASVLGGISGTVVAADGGRPLTGATVAVAGNTMLVAARGPTAYYNKPSAPGTYRVTASAPGYVAQTVTVEVPANGNGGVANFVLSRA